jgi:chromosome segregation ATPase
MLQKNQGGIMGRIGISYQDVIKAIPQLQGQQRNPTVDNIREILGTGSKSTIARFLREWKSKNGLQNTDDGTLPVELLEMLKALWGRLQEKTDTRAVAYQKEADARIEKIQQELHQQCQFQTDSQHKIHTLEEELHQQMKEKEQIKTAFVTEQQEKIKLMERSTALGSHLEESLAENKRLHQFLKQVQENLEHYQASTQQLRQEQSLLIEKQRSEYEQKLLQLQIQIETITNEKSLYQAKYTELNKACEILEKKESALILAYKEIEKQHESLKSSYERTQEDHKRLLKNYQEKSKDLASKQQAVIELQLTNKAEGHKITALEEALSKANDKIDTLRHEFQFTSQAKANLEGQLKQLEATLGSKKVVAA